MTIYNIYLILIIYFLIIIKSKIKKKKKKSINDIIKSCIIHFSYSNCITLTVEDIYYLKYFFFVI